MSDKKHTNGRRALVLAHEADGPGGQIAVRLEQRGFVVTTHVIAEDSNQPNKAAPFPDLLSYDLVAAMGSIRSLTNKAEISTWIHTELDLLRAAHEADVPVLGICFGGQLLAEALGGSVEKAPVTEIGWFEIQPVGDVLNPAGPGPWMEWHHDRFEPPPQAQVLAATDDACQLFSIGRSVGTQFHPEVDYAHIERWLATVDKEYLDEWGQDVDGLLEAMRANDERNTKQCHAFVDWFLDSVAFPTPVDAVTEPVDH